MLKILKNLGKREIGIIIASFILIMGQVWFDLKLPDYMSEITVLVQTKGNQMTEILKNGGYMLLCALGSMFMSIITGYLIANSI